MALALQQALGQELVRVHQGSPEGTGVAVRLLQAMASLLNSPHGGALAVSMQRHHFLACPLLRLLSQYQVGCPHGGGLGGRPPPPRSVHPGAEGWFPPSASHPDALIGLSPHLLRFTCECILSFVSRPVMLI